MSNCCAASKPDPNAVPGSAGACPLGWFEDMIEHCLDYVTRVKESGRPVVGILCEYAPREILLAAGAVPVCLCGGSAEMIPAAEHELPNNLCPLIKSTYGFHLERANPFLEMCDLVVAETTCDGKKKMFELLAAARPTYLIEIPHKDDGAEARALWESELRRFRRFLEERFSVVVSDSALRAGIRVMNCERRLRRQLAELMKSDCPPLTGRQLLEFKSSVSGIPEDLAMYDEAYRLLSARTPDPALSGRVRVLLTGVPVVHGAERVVDLIEGHGGLIVCMENCTGLKPILDDVAADAADPIHALADKYFRLACSVRTPNTARANLVRDLARAYRAECIIDLVWQACLTYDVESARIKQVAETELNVPYLRIQTDYAPADTERIAVRVEALFETVRARRQNGTAACSSQA